MAVGISTLLGACASTNLEDVCLIVHKEQYNSGAFLCGAVGLSSSEQWGMVDNSMIPQQSRWMCAFWCPRSNRTLGLLVQVHRLPWCFRACCGSSQNRVEHGTQSLCVSWEVGFSSRAWNCKGRRSGVVAWKTFLQMVSSFFLCGFKERSASH
jgi:hypothetical protein